MEDTNTYGKHINDKFSELSFPDMDITWRRMKALLDKQMPRRRFGLWFGWSSGSALLLIGVSMATIITARFFEGMI
ncbi:MAG: hypothetical protein ACJ749_06275, partial [Flavisolibacter sp.]